MDKDASDDGAVENKKAKGSELEPLSETAEESNKLDPEDKTGAKLFHPSGDIVQETKEHSTASAPEPPEEVESSETITFTLVFSKTKHSITWGLDKPIISLKHHIQSLTKVAPAMQKLMFKGLLKDEKTLREAGVTNGIKMMLVGSKLQDVISINSVDKGAASSSSREVSEKKREPLSKQKPHAKIIEKGIPDDAMPGYLNGRERLPTTPLKGMVNKHGNKVRLTFKLESDELWLGTKDRTEKLPLNSIKDVIADKIEDHPGYHMMALQLGPTEQSRYWIYWVPSQYVEAIKDAVLGKWQVF